MNNPENIVILTTTISRRIGEETLLINLVTNEVYTLNVTASRYWELLSSGKKSDEIIAVLKEEFEVSDSVLRREIDSIKDQLSEKKFIQLG